MGRGRPETIIQPDGIKPYNWEGQYGTVASYRDGKSHVWQHNKEQPQQQDQQGQFPGGVINVSGTCMRLYNESTLSIRQTDYTGLSGYVNIYGNMCMNVQHALELRNSSQLDIQNSHIRGSAFNSSRSENCGASGIYCRGTGVVSIEASDARSNELRTTEILGGNAIQKSIKRDHGWDTNEIHRTVSPVPLSYTNRLPRSTVGLTGGLTLCPYPNPTLQSTAVLFIIVPWGKTTKTMMVSDTNLALKNARAIPPSKFSDNPVRLYTVEISMKSSKMIYPVVWKYLRMQTFRFTVATFKGHGVSGGSIG
mmetsp:Transcript_26408/g.49857  ORF Transcript_26408/g.49857 Transcript_26408/m.49857 type:complete len:308 (+) Transcript_26408:136-1059(+)